jgi:hypothetical protein
MKVLFQFYYFYAVRTVGPVMVPADYAVTLSRVVAMCPEAAGAELKLDTHEALMVSRSLVGYAVWKTRADLFDSELEAGGHACKKEDDTQFILWCVLQRCPDQAIWPCPLHRVTL